MDGNISTKWLNRLATLKKRLILRPLLKADAGVPYHMPISTDTKPEEKVTSVSSSLKLWEQHYWDQNKVTSSETWLKFHIFFFLTVVFEMTCIIDGEHPPSAMARSRQVFVFLLLFSPTGWNYFHPWNYSVVVWTWKMSPQPDFLKVASIK